MIEQGAERENETAAMLTDHSILYSDRPCPLRALLTAFCSWLFSPESNSASSTIHSLAHAIHPHGLVA